MRTPGTDAPAERDPVVGRRLADRYHVESLLASGGMARIYRAADERLGRRVAVKILARPYADDPAFVDRFLREARAAASVSHANLVHVYDSGSDGGLHFIVMELLARHRSLRELLATGGPLPAAEAGRIVADVLAGLEAVHERGLVHCDVKSGNILLGPGPTKLIDFGIARSPGDGGEGSTSIGSLHYMSPEQLRGEPLTPRSDIFAAGAVLYEALTGRMPYPGRTPPAVAAAHGGGPPPAPSALEPGVPPALDRVVLRALDPDPARRWRGAAEMAGALEAALAEREEDETRPVATIPAPAGYAYLPPTPEREAPHASAPAARPAERRPRRSVAGALGTLVLLGAAALVGILVVLPLLRAGGTGAPSPVATAPATPTLAPNEVRVPDTIGMSADEAIAAARDASLDWTLFCEHDESRPEQVYSQEPAAGTIVPRGSRFVMYWPRYPGPCGGG
ncbi:MAG TPA: protein kinase [Candidatus Limnocylindria bacterium]|nr:protein kinase [Candidatus Limnocylindria bacterium]